MGCEWVYLFIYSPKWNYGFPSRKHSRPAGRRQLVGQEGTERAVGVEVGKDAVAGDKQSLTGAVT